MTDRDYKNYSLREFNKAAEQFDDNSPSVYNLCRNDYPDILSEIETENWRDLLDAGCGTGAVISLLKEKYSDKNYTGIDLRKASSYDKQPRDELNGRNERIR